MWVISQPVSAGKKTTVNKIAKNLSDKKIFGFFSPLIKIRILMPRWPSTCFLLRAGLSGERDRDQHVLELGGQGARKAVALGL